VEGTVNNWGRWGAADERGSLNLLTDESRLEALSRLQYGRLYALAYPYGRDGSPYASTRDPIWHTMAITRKRNGIGVTDDVLTVHSHVGTHMDALCHYWGPAGLYNGFSQEAIVSSGAPHLSIDRVGGIVCGAVLIDLSARLPEGRSALGFEFGVAHLEEELNRSGITIESGDAVLIYTGWSEQFRTDPELYNWGEPGIGVALAEWLAEKDIVLVGADNFAVEAVPPAVRGAGLPVHQALLNRFGIYILENLDLRDVVRAEGTTRGVLALAPLLITRGCGSPVNPLFMV
jgi:kynurenine formamidase